MDNTIATALITGFGTILLIMACAIGKIWSDYKQLVGKCETLQTRHTDCEIKTAKMEGRIEGLQREVDLLRGKHLHDDAMPGFWIIASVEGIIIDLGGHVESITKYRPLDLIGKNVSQLIPSELYAAHHAGLERVRNGAAVRRQGITGELIAADGTRVPSATFLGLIEHHHERCIRAEIFEIARRENDHRSN